MLGTPVLESGSLGLAALAEGGGVSEDTGLPFSSLISLLVGEVSAPWMITEGSCCRATRATAASLL